jgi:hypothetical protein
MSRGEPEHGVEGDVPIDAPMVSEDKLDQVRVDVLAAQSMMGAELPMFHQREEGESMAGPHDLQSCRPSADRAGNR